MCSDGEGGVVVEGGVESSSPVPEPWISNTVGSMADFVLMCLQQHYFCGLIMSP